MFENFTFGQVYAIDLLGFGRSDKPLMSYSIELWTEQLLDFLSEFVSQPSILVGNSIGSLISLMVMASCSSQYCCLLPRVPDSPYVASAHAACAEQEDLLGLYSIDRAKPTSDLLSIAVQASAEGGPERVKGTVLLNCAGGMNTKVGFDVHCSLMYSHKPLHLCRLTAS